MGSWLLHFTSFLFIALLLFSHCFMINVSPFNSSLILQNIQVAIPLFSNPLPYSTACNRLSRTCQEGSVLGYRPRDLTAAPRVRTARTSDLFYAGWGVRRLVVATGPLLERYSGRRPGDNRMGTSEAVPRGTPRVYIAPS